jgi:CheY-like chemotaxis protein
VLVAETYDDSRVMLSTLLALNGYDVAESVDGQSTLDQVARLSPEVVLLDDSLPTPDAWTVARRLQAGGAPQAPGIVFMSCRAGSAPESTAQACGSEGYFVKPIEPEALLRAVRRLCDQRHARKS